MATVWRKCDEYKGAVQLTFASSPVSSDNLPLAYPGWLTDVQIGARPEVKYEVRVSDNFGNINSPLRWWEAFEFNTGGTLNLSGYIYGSASGSETDTKSNLLGVLHSIRGTPFNSITITSSATDSSVLVLNDCMCTASSLKITSFAGRPVIAGAVTYWFAAIT